jgi:hypothetical protein
MQAKKVFEKFTEDSDPIRDLGIGSPYGKIKIVLKELKDEFGGKIRIIPTEHKVTGYYYFEPKNRDTYCTIIYYNNSKIYREVIRNDTNYWPVESPDKWKRNVIRAIKRKFKL